jgi:hypothetical protein
LIVQVVGPLSRTIGSDLVGPVKWLGVEVRHLGQTVKAMLPGVGRAARCGVNQCMLTVVGCANPLERLALLESGKFIGKLGLIDGRVELDMDVVESAA